MRERLQVVMAAVWLGLALLLAVAAVVKAAPLPLGPVEPITARDVSFKTWLDYPSSAYAWFHGRTARMDERRNLEWTLTTVWVPRVMDFAETLPGVAAAEVKCQDVLTIFFKRLGRIYVEDSLCPQGRYQTPANGRTYSFQFLNCLRPLRDALTGSAATACGAANPSPDLRDLLWIDVADGRCVKRPDLPTDPRGPIDSAMKDVGALVQGAQPTPIPPKVAALVDASTDCHAKASAEHCGGPPAGCSVAAAHLAAENATPDVNVRNAVTPLAFAGGFGADYSDAEQCTIAMAQHAAHHPWAMAARDGDVCHATLAGVDHGFCHVCGNLNRSLAAGVYGRPPCGKASVRTCPVVSCLVACAGMVP